NNCAKARLHSKLLLEGLCNLGSFPTSPSARCWMRFLTLCGLKRRPASDSTLGRGSPAKRLSTTPVSSTPTKGTPPKSPTTSPLSHHPRRLAGRQPIVTSPVER